MRSVSGSVQPEHRTEQRGPSDQARVEPLDGLAHVAGPCPLVEAEEVGPHAAPPGVRRLGRERGRLAAREGHAVGDELRDEAADQSGLAGAGLGLHHHDLALAGLGGPPELPQPLQLLLAADHGVEGGRDGGARAATGGPVEQPAYGHLLLAALHGDRGQVLPDEPLVGRVGHVAVHPDPARRRAGHQAGGEVDRVAEAAEGTALAVAVGTAAQASGGHPDLHVGDGYLLGDLEQPQGPLAGAGRVVLVGDRRAEHGVQVGALVADGELEDVAALLVEDLLGPGDEGVEHFRRLRVALEVQAAEPHEHRHGRSEVGQELAATGHHPLPDGRQQPLAGRLLGELGPPRRRCRAGTAARRGSRPRPRRRARRAGSP